jgi:hypothetical protein
MAKKGKKEKREKKRKKALKQKKSQRRASPKLLRNEALLDALSPRHPLLACLINREWQHVKLATILTIRDAPHGLIFANYVVDLAQSGLREAWGSYPVDWGEIDMIKAEAARAGFDLIPCEESLAEKIVHGGIAWAKKWGYKLPREYRVWIRLLEPPPEAEFDLFGADGEPLLIEADEDEEASYEEILSHEIQMADWGFTKQTLIRIGDIKEALVRFADHPEFDADMEMALEERFGEPKPPDSEHGWITFLDWFVLQYELYGGGTIARRFVERYERLMSEDVRELILGWENVIEGLYEIKGLCGYGMEMKNLINEKEYRVFPTAHFEEPKLAPGDFVYGRIVPAKNFHLFSGGMATLSSDGSQTFRAKIYKEALEIQMRNPQLAFKDNPWKLQKSRESVRKYYEAFIECFETDEVSGTGRDILEQYRSFFEYLVGKQRSLDQETSAYPPKVELPDEVLESDDVGMLCDSVEGIFFLIGYRRFIDIFRFPEQHLGKEETEDLVMGYLESESVSDVPLRRMAERYPENFRRVIRYYGDRIGFVSGDIEDLMQEFKPRTFDKLPGIVTILDPRMTRQAEGAEQQSSSKIGRIKKWLKGERAAVD